MGSRTIEGRLGPASGWQLYDMLPLNMSSVTAVRRSSNHVPAHLSITAAASDAAIGREQCGVSQQPAEAVEGCQAPFIKRRCKTKDSRSWTSGC